MKKRILSLVMAAAVAVTGISVGSFAVGLGAQSVQASDSIPAFPGAEGGGKYTTGGRGGTVYHVTNLNDSGTGSFRDAVSSSNRIVVFDVGGTIELKSDVVVKSNVTIAGQTAPGGHGVTLKNYKVGLGGSNIIMRYISSRPGERGSSAEYDALGGSDGSNSIIDHCAFGWANDEQWGLYSNNDMYTTQWTIVGPANCFSYHSKGIHGFGVMFGKSNTTWHHNLIAHNISRNFRGKVEGTNTAEFVNNVIYNWGYETAYGTLGHLNYVGNYLKKGAKTSGIRYINISSGSNYEKFRFYMTGNRIVEKDDSVISAEDSDWDYVNYGSSGYTKDSFYSSTPFSITSDLGEDISYVGQAETADEAYANVTSYVGPAVDASSRTDIDAQVIYETLTGTGNLTGARDLSEASSSQQESIDTYGIVQTTYTYPEATYASDYSNTYTDTDGDGMPDWWELERGLDPYSASTSETNGDYCGQGYTNIEYYLNDLTVNSFPEGTVEASPTIGTEVTVDPNGTDSDETGNAVRTTIAKAMAYIESSDSQGTKTIHIKDGTYSEDITVTIDNVNISLAEGASSVTVGSITVGGSNFLSTGINYNGVTVNGNEAVFTDCTGSSVNLNSGTRSYFSGCTLSGRDNLITSSNAQAVFEGCTITSTGNISSVTASSYAVEFKDSTLTGTSIASGSGTVATYNCTTNISGTRYSGVTAAEYGNSSSDSSATVYTAETAFLNAYYGPYNFTKGSDGWNPGGWDTETPQESLAALADSITVPSPVTSNTTVTTSFESDSDVTVTWTTDNTDRFSNNTILIGEYGEGAVTITLTATVSKAGLADEVRTFTVVVGSAAADTDGIVTFDECSDGDVPSYFTDSSTVTTDSISGYVTSSINGVTFADHDKFYVIDQSGTTGDNIHNFRYVFSDENVTDSVYETSYDVYIDSISTDGYCEAYVRGTSTVGQVRFIENGGDYSIMGYSDSSSRSELVTAGSQWYTVKMVVDASTLSSGTEPVINYYLYDSDGDLVKSLKNCSPVKAFTADTYADFEANRLEFRPNRNYEQVKFYLDNLSYTNLTELAEEDAASLSENTTLTLSSGDSLPTYGDHMTTITWTAADGTEGIVNSDGTINYSAFAAATVKVKATVSAGDDLVGTAESSVITLNLTGTGSGTVTAADPSFSDTDDFSDWNVQQGYSSVVDRADTTSVSGNSSTKIKLEDKAVFKVLDGSLGTGTATFTADFLRVKDSSSNTTGRSFRIYFENAETANADGEATETFATTNIIYHLMDAGDSLYSVTSDSPSANSAVDTALNQSVSDSQWYRVVVNLDLDNKTAETNVYLHDTDGIYNPDGTFDTPLVTETTNLVSKSPMQLKQIRLVRTAASVVYFDNVSLSVDTEDEPAVEPDEPDEPVVDLPYDVNNDGVVDSNDAEEILCYVLNRNSSSLSEDFDEEKADINSDGVVTAIDAQILSQYVLDNK
ncbi:MAG: dockerin type I domain-containing protein [Clostridiales bacterium]|nr:dockerin type I domain-containing protein [Clostridiales bacterium]